MAFLRERLSMVALIVSLCALLFGGLFSGLWQRKLSQPMLSCVVESITHRERLLDTAKVVIPPDLVKRTSEARYFPSLDAEMTIAKLREELDLFISIDYPGAAARLREALVILKDPSVAEAEAIAAWKGLANNAKSVLFASRTSRMMREYMRGMSSQQVEAIASWLMKRAAQGAKKPNVEGLDLDDPRTKDVLRRTSMEAVRAEISPTRSFLTELIESDIADVEAASAEHLSLVPVVSDLLRTAELGAASTVSWEVRVIFHNSGSAPGSVYPYGALALQRQASGNTVVPLECNKPAGNIIVLPGGTIDATFDTPQDVDKDLVSSLVSDFESTEKNFRLVFLEMSGEEVTSPVGIFSRSAGEDLRKRINKHASEVTI